MHKWSSDQPAAASVAAHILNDEVAMDRRRETAVHEAGHAVAARVLGIVCGEVTIKPYADDVLGHSVFADPRFDWERGDGSKAKAANAFAVALFAGAEAERLLLGTQAVGDGADQERATACLAWAGAVRGAAFVGDDAFDRHERNLRRKAVDLVRKHRAEIELVAEGLLDFETLSNSDVNALISR